MIDEGAPKQILPPQNDQNIITLAQSVDNLLKTRSPFEYRAKVESFFLQKPTEVLQILVDRFPTESDDEVVVVSSLVECNMTTMAWMGEALCAKTSRTPEENNLLHQSTDYIIGTIRNPSVMLGTYMGASIALFRFTHEDDYRIQQLTLLADDTYQALEDSMNKIKQSSEKYHLRGYFHDNNLLENLLERLHELSADDRVLVENLSKLDPNHSGPFNGRLIYTSRRWLKDKPSGTSS
ncbi:MAG TPA: hypothetical protein VMR81_07895 [Patescibacteria group bacterium]|nr:hypothetical protein [Patescibacteria group bacterium]